MRSINRLSRPLKEKLALSGVETSATIHSPTYNNKQNKCLTCLTDYSDLNEDVQSDLEADSQQSVFFVSRRVRS